MDLDKNGTVLISTPMLF